MNYNNYIYIQNMDNCYHYNVKTYQHYRVYNQNASLTSYGPNITWILVELNI